MTACEPLPSVIGIDYERDDPMSGLVGDIRFASRKLKTKLAEDRLAKTLVKPSVKWTVKRIADHVLGDFEKPNAKLRADVTAGMERLLAKREASIAAIRLAADALAMTAMRMDDDGVDETSCGSSHMCRLRNADGGDIGSIVMATLAGTISILVKPDHGETPDLYREITFGPLPDHVLRRDGRVFDETLLKNARDGLRAIADTMERHHRDVRRHAADNPERPIDPESISRNEEWIESTGGIRAALRTISLLAGAAGLSKFWLSTALPGGRAACLVDERRRTVDEGSTAPYIQKALREASTGSASVVIEVEDEFPRRVSIRQMLLACDAVDDPVATMRLMADMDARAANSPTRDDEQDDEAFDMDHDYAMLPVEDDDPRDADDDIAERTRP
jgi:hypothetical protein